MTFTIMDYKMVISTCLHHRKFDLKGSTVDREASDKELEKNLPTLKDNDFIKQKIRICIGEAAKEKLFEMLNADVNVMYSIPCQLDFCLILYHLHLFAVLG